MKMEGALIPREVFGAVPASKRDCKDAAKMEALNKVLTTSVASAKRSLAHEFGAQTRQRKERCSESRRRSSRGGGGSKETAHPAEEEEEEEEEGVGGGSEVMSHAKLEHSSVPLRLCRLVLEDVLALRPGDKVELWVPRSGGLFDEYRQSLVSQGTRPGHHLFQREGGTKGDVFRFPGSVVSNPFGEGYLGGSVSATDARRRLYSEGQGLNIQLGPSPSFQQPARLFFI
jgi:hypothetical protein